MTFSPDDGKVTLLNSVTRLSTSSVLHSPPLSSEHREGLEKIPSDVVFLIVAHAGPRNSSFFLTEFLNPFRLH